MKKFTCLAEIFLLYQCRHNCTKLPEQMSYFGLDQRASVWEKVEFGWPAGCARCPLAYTWAPSMLVLSYPSALLLAQLPALISELSWVYWSSWLWELLCLSLLSSCDYRSWAPENVCEKGVHHIVEKAATDFYQFPVSPESSLAVRTVLQEASPSPSYCFYRPQL